jgi:hypothetical protein
MVCAVVVPTAMFPKLADEGVIDSAVPASALAVVTPAQPLRFQTTNTVNARKHTNLVLFTLNIPFSEPGTARGPEQERGGVKRFR